MMILNGLNIAQWKKWNALHQGDVQEDTAGWYQGGHEKNRLSQENAVSEKMKEASG